VVLLLLNHRSHSVPLAMPNNKQHGKLEEKRKAHDEPNAKPKLRRVISKGAKPKLRRVISKGAMLHKMQKTMQNTKQQMRETKEKHHSQHQCNSLKQEA
jgi:hypothetical protein